MLNANHYTRTAYSVSRNQLNQKSGRGFARKSENEIDFSADQLGLEHTPSLGALEGPADLIGEAPRRRSDVSGAITLERERSWCEPSEPAPILDPQAIALC
jgi:hypothetical protein